MKSLERVIFVLVSVSLVIGITFYLLGRLKTKKAGISIETVPAALVYLDGVQVGRTPYEATAASSEVVVKLIPESLGKPLVPYETKVSLGAGIITEIKREFGESEETSAGEVISFEKTGAAETSLTVVSVPDSAQVFIDGQLRGSAPIKLTDIVVGEHQIAVSADGFIERTMTVNTLMGYKLTAIVKLAVNAELLEEEKQTEQPKEPEKVYQVEILTTPNGFLRVRSEPSTTADELVRVESGEKFKFIEEDGETSWFKIQYEEGKEGWVSGDYAKKVEETSD